MLLEAGMIEVVSLDKPSHSFPSCRSPDFPSICHFQMLHLLLRLHIVREFIKLKFQTQNLH